VQAGTIHDKALLPVIHAAAVDDDWTAPVTRRKAHPGIGISVLESFIAAECEKAKGLPSYENNFRRLMLNQWNGAGDALDVDPAVGQMRISVSRARWTRL